jgi:TrmH family RNA methyltransferase
VAKETITSRRHALIRELQDIRDDRDSPLMFLEGPRLVEEVLGTGLPIEILVWTPAAESTPVWSQAGPRAKRKFQVSASVFEAVSDVESPQGILAIARCPTWGWKSLFSSLPSPVVVLDGLQDPGNVATIIRTAEAAGAAGLLTTPGTAHVYAPKALRSAAGSSLRLPILEHQPVREIILELSKHGITLVGASPRTEASSPADVSGGSMIDVAMMDPGLPSLQCVQGGGPRFQENRGAGQPAGMTTRAASISYLAFDWSIPVAIVLGQEGQGLSDAWTAQLNQLLHIPMKKPVESLNVASTAAILLYESFRQRSSKHGVRPHVDTGPDP